MSEHSPTPDRRYSDDELIEMSLVSSEDMESTIEAATARMIASQFHAGQSSDLYSLASTGYISDDLLDEIARAYNEFKDQPAEQRKIAALSVYVAERKSRGDVAAVDGWSKLWLEAPNESDDLCPCCFEHISAYHRVGCPLGVDDEQLLGQVQALRSEHGTAILLWLSYVGFRNSDELAAAGASFADHYQGRYSSVLDYARFVADNLDNPPSVEELVDEVNQTMYVAEGLNGEVYIFDR